MNPPSPPPFSCIGSITLQWPVKISKNTFQGAHAYWCANNLLQLRSPTAVYTFRKSRHQWTQSHFVQIESCVVRTELLTAEEEDDISHPRRSNLFRWTQRSVSMVFFEAVKIQIPNKSYSTPKKYTPGFLENDRTSEFPLDPRESKPPFSHVLQGPRVIQESHQVWRQVFRRFASPRYSLDEVHPSKGHIGQHVDDHRTP